MRCVWTLLSLLVILSLLSLLLNIVVVIAADVSVSVSVSHGGATATRASALPRTEIHVEEDFYQEPWYGSSQVDAQGFLKSNYTRIPAPWEDEPPYRSSLSLSSSSHSRRWTTACIRQVPGDGNCLFHAIAVGLYQSQRGKHMDFRHDDFQELKQMSQTLRHQSSRYLRRHIMRRRLRLPIPLRRRRSSLLYLTGREYMSTQVLLQRFQSMYGLTPQEYCDAMECNGVWAGGPEIVALCNLLKRPIHLYQLTVNDGTNDNNHNNKKKKEFCIRPMCCFGSPKYDARADAIYILTADARFPQIRPGRQKQKGNHFLAIFPHHHHPSSTSTSSLSKRKRKKM